MSTYVLVESRDPFESRDVSHYYVLATSLAAKGETVKLFFVQNGVLALRNTIPSNPLAEVIAADIEILADEFSLKERGITETDTLMGVQATEIGTLVDLALADTDTKVIWH